MSVDEVAHRLLGAETEESFERIGPFFSLRVSHVAGTSNKLHI